ncbi:peptidase C60 [Micromonospora rifamycinica]|uniref:Sortase family protein n=2 Tax=Micromonospora rifamycinica TaxID=291594 RepID=A0A120F8L9_9ACTN|nr:class F sortase [Micromonospora rifamycinica]KWV32017.1 peptidase C60 [Micromonospora rifamycinica]SCG80309.1 Sortase family protein [Micromonospora rifamycinica]
MARTRHRRSRPAGRRLRAAARRTMRAAARIHRRSRRLAARIHRRSRRAAARFRRVAGQAFSASVTTADPVTQARPVRPVPRQPAFGGRFASGGPGLPVLAIAAVMLLIVTMLGVERVTGRSVLPDRFVAGLRPPPKKFPVLSGSPPTQIAISRIDLRATVHRVGIAPDGSIAVPDTARAQEAGWYDQGPTPGQYGPAVIVGHVDTTTGPAVFHGLKELHDGDEIEVTRADRRVAVFEVDEIQRYRKERLPVDQIYGDFSRPRLRLITCGGRWVGGATGYADNLVVYATLVRAD